LLPAVDLQDTFVLTNRPADVYPPAMPTRPTKNARILRTTLVILGGIGALGAALTAFGYMLPVAHTATRSATFPAPPARVFAILEDVERYPSWRRHLTKAEIVQRAPALRWREQGRDDEILFEMEERHPPQRLVTRIADRSLPYGGSWTFVLEPSGDGTSLTITENGEVYNPVFRLMSRFVFGHAATIDRFLEDLRGRLSAP
jgi:uncharacterized protein YndB with AHSA1/START domain